MVLEGNTYFLSTYVYLVGITLHQSLTNKRSKSLSHYDMVKHLHSQYLSCFPEPSGNRQVFMAGSRVSRRMVVHEDDRRRRTEEGGLEGLPGMDYRLVQATNTDEPLAKVYARS